MLTDLWPPHLWAHTHIHMQAHINTRMHVCAYTHKWNMLIQGHSFEILQMPIDGMNLQLRVVSRCRPMEPA